MMDGWMDGWMDGYKCIFYVVGLASNFHELKNPAQFVLIFCLENMSFLNKKLFEMDFDKGNIIDNR